METINIEKLKKLIPQLRFNSFNSDWQLITIGSFIKDRKIVATSNVPLYSLTIEHGVVPKSKRYERSFLVKGDEGAYKLMYPNDFAFNPMNLRFGALAKYKGEENVAVSKYYDIFYTLKGCDPDYLEYYLTSYKMIQFYNKMSTGTLEEKKRVHYLDFINFKKLFPSLPEQQKIASFLTAVDDKLQALKQKLTLLEQYKKGVMQKIFAQELRFKPSPIEALEIGDEYPDWEEKKLGEVAVFLDGKRKPIKSEDRSKMKGIYPYYGASGIIDYVNDYIFDEELILLGEDGENIVSRNLPLAFRVSGKCWVNNHAHVIKPIDNNNVNFLTYILERINYVIYNTGTAQPKLNQEVCRNIPLLIPSIPEQTKIASFLSAIDEKIEKTTQQLTQTETFKKGLLQQLFV